MKRRNKLANDRPSRRHWRPRRFFFVSFFSFGVVIDMMVLFILRNNPSNSLIDRWINLSIAFSSILNEKCWLFHWSFRYCWRIWVSFVDLFCHNVSIHRRLGVMTSPQAERHWLSHAGRFGDSQSESTGRKKRPSTPFYRHCDCWVPKSSKNDRIPSNVITNKIDIGGIGCFFKVFRCVNVKWLQANGVFSKKGIDELVPRDIS